MAKKRYCVVGYYFSPEEILEAAEKAKVRQFEKFDTFTPFPVHGMDQAMGIKRSTLPYVAFGAGMFGLANAVFLQVWTHAINWPINIAAKPKLAIPAYVPIFFELTILLAGVTTVIAMFGYYLGLPNYKKPIFHPDITNDRFALAIEVTNEEQVESVKRFLKEIRAQEIHHVEGEL
jgi:hypothetical protein